MRKSVTKLFLGAMFFCFLYNQSIAQSLPAYRFYNSEGKELTYSDVIKQLVKKDVVLFGELHNNPIDHWIQLELTKSLLKERELVLGAEMFETDDQMILNEYLQGSITADHFVKEAKVWPNYKTDYAPLVDLAVAEHLPFIATNVPRRYASMVAKQGQEALIELGQGALQLMPALPFEVTPDDQGYAEMRTMMGGHSHGMNMEFLIQAQALKDYTMASNILLNRTAKQLFIHFNGSFHSQYRAGIVNYLLKQQKRLEVAVIAAVEGDGELSFQSEWTGLGDIILVTPNAMTKTH